MTSGDHCRPHQGIGCAVIAVRPSSTNAVTRRTFGTSLLTRIAQILDDIGNTDTDLAAASQTAAPALVTTGVPAGGLEGGPGQQWAMPAESTAGYLDTSKNLTALREFDKDLLDRLPTNSRLALALLGRVQPNDVPSAYALSLGFQPARQLLRGMPKQFVDLPGGGCARSSRGGQSA